MNTIDIYNLDYLPYMVKWGRITCTCGIIFGFLPAIALWIFFGFVPNWKAVGAGVGMIVAALGVAYFTDPIACVPVIGVPGTMMAYLSGNANNLRIPCSLMAQDIAKTEPGTPEAECVSVLGMAASVFVNIFILIICAVGGVGLISILPEKITAGFSYMLPCVFGACFMQFALKTPKMVPICLAIAWLLRFGIKLGFLPSGLSSFVTLICMVLTIAIGIQLARKEGSAKKEE